MNLFKNVPKSADNQQESSMTEAIRKLASVDPEHILVEHVCIAFGVSRKRARQICDDAIERGLFHRVNDLGNREVFALCDDAKTFQKKLECNEGNRWTRWPVPDRHVRR
jgi:hypothetical protein